MYLAMLFVVSLFSIGAQIAAGPAGHWEGKLQVPERELAITIDLARTPAGVWIGSMSIPLSTSIDVPLGNLTIEGTVVRFTAFLPAKATFEGTLSAEGKALSGTAANAEGKAPFQLARQGEANVKVLPPSSQLPKEFEGEWEGAVEAGGQTKRIGLKLVAAADGTATGVLISSAPGVGEIPISVVTITGSQIEVESRPLSGTFRGTLGAGGEIAGEWSQRALQVPLTFRRVSPPSRRASDRFASRGAPERMSPAGRPPSAPRRIPQW